VGCAAAAADGRPKATPLLPPLPRRSIRECRFLIHRHLRADPVRGGVGRPAAGWVFATNAGGYVGQVA
jgi:hypothetical protein